jgi:hypothetical protein
MGWFSKKEALTSPLVPQTKYHFAGVPEGQNHQEVAEFVRQMSKAEVEATFQKYGQHGAGMVRFPSRRKEEIGHSMKMIQESWDGINVNDVSEAELVDMYNMFNYGIPAILSRWSKRVLQNGELYAWEGDTYSDDKNPPAHQVAYILSLLEETRLNQNVRVTETERTKKMQTTFPSTLYAKAESVLGSRTVERKEFDTVKALWTQVSGWKDTLSEEDKFFLDQVITEYLPSALSVYSLFELADAEKKTEAKESLREQFDLIVSHMRLISKDAFHSELGTLRKQADFLRGQVANEASSKARPLEALKG